MPTLRHIAATVGQTLWSAPDPLVRQLKSVRRGAAVSLFLLAALPLLAQSPTAIRGFAFDADGRPVANATITLSGSSDATATSAADGSFEFPNLAPGHYRVAGTESKRQIISEQSTSLDLKASETIEADVTLAASTKHYPRWKRILRRLDGIH